MNLIRIDVNALAADSISYTQEKTLIGVFKT